MASTQNLESLQKEGRLSLTQQAIQNKQFWSVRRAATSYNVPRTTLRLRIHGSFSITKSNAKKRKLQLSEEQALVQWVLDLDRRGFPPHIIDVRRMADTLLAARGENPPPQPVSKNWVSRFLNAQPELKRNGIESSTHSVPNSEIPARLTRGSSAFRRRVSCTAF
ncbi:hypothetical protein MPH_13473 [Macrophomina phaseolina MS6]|uniref:HTH CENPB-type domain-containing protein n=1 Tax=Macrophomina phaseolina (strain MS6) TaxID=1126212 RepID=K2R5N7_MACPH|nr:hypothetical protein MPH_13473 [Macrophomina phaseolina MS6]